MRILVSIRRMMCALFPILFLAGCSTLSLGNSTQIRALDVLNDDVASVVLALDVPVILVPLPDASHVNFEATLTDGQVLILNPALAHADAADLAAGLPPPAQDRGYFLFGLSQPDQLALRELQSQVRSDLPQGDVPQDNAGSGALSISLDIRFCALAEFDPATTEFSILAALPDNSALEPLISEERISDYLARTNQVAVPLCADAIE